MVRYMTNIIVCLVFVLLAMGPVMFNQYIFERIIKLESRLFTDSLNASLLDERVTYTW